MASHNIVSDAELKEKLRPIWSCILADAEVFRSAPDPAAVAAYFEFICQMYTGRNRRHHGLLHIHAGLGDIAEVAHLAEDLTALKFAWFLHDIVYDAYRLGASGMNEDASALLAAEIAINLGVSPEFAAKVHRLIVATKHQQDSAAGDEALIMDIDLIVLAVDPEHFELYSRNIRMESPMANDSDAYAGQCRFLNLLLEQPHIYQTAALRARYEEDARKNLTAAIQRLA